MVKVMNIVFGVGIAVIVFIVALLGIQAFYPEPKYENYCNYSMYTIPAESTVSGIYDCPGNITVTECIKIINDNQVNSAEAKVIDQEMQACNAKYDTASRNYNKTFFIIASILGLIALIVSFFLLGIINVSAGVASAGIVLIVVAFTRGWSNTNDILKFVIGLVIGAVIVFLTLKINRLFSGNEETPVKNPAGKRKKSKQ